MTDLQHAIAPGRIRCEVIISTDASRRYTLQVPAHAAIANACVQLVGLYNGQDYPYDLSELRSVDRDIAEDCLAVLRLDSRGLKEVHCYVEDGEAKWAAMIEHYGLKSAVRS